MNSNTRVVCLISLLLLVISVPTWAVVDTHEVDAVREKRVLDERDLMVIDEFMQDAIKELVYTRDFTAIAKTRSIILSRHTASAQYNQKFTDAALEHIAQGFVLAEEFEVDRRNRVRANLLILVHDLADVRLSDIALEWATDDSEPVRFWAIRCLTSPAMVEAINTGSDSTLSLRVLEQIQQEVAQGNENTLELIVPFAGKLTGDVGRDLWEAIVAQRKSAYEQWAVQSPLLDGQVLRLLNQKIAAEGSDHLDCARDFSQLYSYVFQALIKGQTTLSPAVLKDLTTVIVDIEDRCLGTMLGRPQTTLKRAAENDDLDTIKAEHDRLLGTTTTRGELVQELQISYGSLADGREQTQPKQLPMP